VFIRQIRNLINLEVNEMFIRMNDGEIDVSDLSTNQVSSLMGNGWDVNLVSKIFKNLLENWENHTQANPTDLSFNKDLTATQQVATPKPMEDR
jgi:hypothetical protein